MTPVGVTAVTVIAQVAVRLFVVVAVMVALPAATPVTNPDELTVATLVLLELHVTLWFALLGVTVAVSLLGSVN